VHALFDVAHAYGLRPDVVDGSPVLRTMAPGLERALDNWAAMSARLREDGDEEAYALWRDSFDEDSMGAKDLCQTRYRPVFVGGRLIPGASESDYDPWPGYEIRA
jgi:hypothetical protein